MNLRPFLATLCCTFSLSVQAQVTPPAPVPPLAPAPPVTPDKPPPVRERERTIYVPYEELEKIFTDGGKGVFLPYKEFLDLWNELNLKRAKEDEVKPPQEGIVSKAEYMARIEGETLVMDAVVTVESFKKGWLTVPLAKGGVLPGIAQAETGNAVLHAKAAAVASSMSPGPGRKLRHHSRRWCWHLHRSVRKSVRARSRRRPCSTSASFAHRSRVSPSSFQPARNCSA